MNQKLTCPFCGNPIINYRKESFNYKAAFWAALFLSLWGILFGFFCRKRTICYCKNCRNEFSFYGR